jgi:hypothetical protein
MEVVPELQQSWENPILSAVRDCLSQIAACWCSPLKELPDPGAVLI